MDLAQAKKEYTEISEKLTDPELISKWDEFQELSKRRGVLEKIVKKALLVEELKERIAENNQIIASQEDELASLAQEELSSLAQRKEQAQKELEELLRDESQDIPDAIIMEIRPGTGGEEASLFAGDLFRMYTRYAEQKGFKYTILEMDDTELGGIKTASVEFNGKEAVRKLLHEAGVHRVQRIPSTEKAGRIHTSTASVAILPKPKKAQVQLNPSELKVDIYNASGPGGQNVNKRKTAVRITHLPTGLVVASQASRNQQKNRDFAMSLLAAKILQQREETAGAAIAGQRKTQIGSADRSEKIRTYNFPQDRITDHRVKESWHGVERILKGDLDEIGDTLSQNQNL
ncbi:MAG TPA: peptide chain release factor 1 [Candidatus Paceibacterota bacterium]|nr:peptide chain release factor 1 [Candidatus Paceibacterota bacterium]